MTFTKYIEISSIFREYYYHFLIKGFIPIQSFIYRHGKAMWSLKLLTNFFFIGTDTYTHATNNKMVKIKRITFPMLI